MNWDALGAIAELLGAVGVVASLIYVATQIRQNTAATRLQALQQVIASKGEALRELHAGSNAEIYRRGRVSYSDLSDEEQERFGLAIAGYLAVCEYAITAYRDGLVKLGTYEAARRDILAQFEHPGVIEWWQTAKSMFADDFQVYVDELIASNASAA